MQWRYNSADSRVWYLRTYWEVTFAWLPVKDHVDEVWIWMEAVYKRIDRHGMEIYRRVPHVED